MADLFTYLNRLTMKTPIDETKDEFEKKYDPYMINRFMSADKTFLPLVAEMNNPNVTKQMHFDFLDAIIPKAKKYFKYGLKKEKELKEIKYIAEFYEVRLEVAKDYYKLLNKEQVKEIVNFFEKRGIK